MNLCRRQISATAAGLLLAAITARPITAGEVSSRQIQTLSIPAGTPLHLSITVGHVRVRAADRLDIGLRVDTRASTQAALSRASLHIARDGSGLTLTATQMDGGLDASTTTDLMLEVPRSIPRLDISVFEGALELESLSAFVRARVTRGRIDTRGSSGRLDLETELGSITVHHADGRLRSPIRLRTFNGDVKVSMPAAPANVRILALALNGSITSTVPLTERTTVGPRFSEATLGTGDPVVRIDVVNGNIRIEGTR